MTLEGLEIRRLLSVSLDPVTHVLTDTGTAGEDHMSVGVGYANFGGRATSIRVVHNGAVWSFPIGDVSSIVLRGLGGDDTLEVKDAVTKPAQIFGGAGHDKLTGGGGVDFLFGGDGSNEMNGGGGDDYLWGGVGDGDGDRNRFYSSPGADSAFGGEDWDIFYAGGDEDLEPDYYDGGGSFDVIHYYKRTVGVAVSLDDVANDGWGGGAEGDNVVDCEKVYGTSGPDTLVGNEESNSLLGGLGGDSIDGKGGNDALYGMTHEYDFVQHGSIPGALSLDGNNTLIGGAGDDRLFGGYHDDHLSGGDGNDELYGDWFWVTAWPEDEANASLWPKGNDYLDGGSGDDELWGLAGTDTLFGGTGTDYMNGGPGGDSYFAKDGYVDEIEDKDLINGNYDDWAQYDSLHAVSDIVSGIEQTF
jgi:Ca2+-binding RTX toxin-like protein